MYEVASGKGGRWADFFPLCLHEVFSTPRPLTSRELSLSLLISPLTSPIPAPHLHLRRFPPLLTPHYLD
jgi:hypothetical protein